MRPAKSVGRTMGVLLLVQLAAAPLVNFVLLRPLTAPPGFLANAAGSSFQIGAGVLLSFAAGALSVGVAVTAFPVFRRYSQPMALWLLALSVVGFALLAVENVAVMSMLSLSQEYWKAGAADAGLFQALGTVAGSARKWAHNASLLVGGGAVFVLYGVLYRSALVPRALAASGAAAAALHVAAITMPFFGYRVLFLLLAPLGLSHLALTLWLLARGFDERRTPPRAAEQEVELSGA